MVARSWKGKAAGAASNVYKAPGRIEEWRIGDFWVTRLLRKIYRGPKPGVSW